MHDVLVLFFHLLSYYKVLHPGPLDVVQPYLYQFSQFAMKPYGRHHGCLIQNCSKIKW